MPTFAHAATNVYYSVGQNTSDHKTGSPTMTISSGVATFSTAQLGTTTGVGDLVTYNTSSQAYISGKISSTQWTLVTATGGAPSNVSNATVNSIAHVYSSLAAALTGFTDASHLNSTDLVAGNYVVNIPCYYDSGADPGDAVVTAVTTGANNYLRIYTPYNTGTEVNQSQRHTGKWSPTKFNITEIRSSNNTPTALGIGVSNAWVDGLQFRVTNDATVFGNILALGLGPVTTSDDYRVSNNFFWEDNSTYTPARGFFIYLGYVGDGGGTRRFRIYNNVFTGQRGDGQAHAVTVDPNNSWATQIVYNNTFYDNADPIYLQTSAAFMFNNLFSSSSIQGFGSWGNADYNATDGSQVYAFGTPGANDRVSQTFSFVDKNNLDFHLTSTDAGARNFGANLSADSNLAFSTDIDGQNRPYGASWDIGADEYTLVAAPTVTGQAASSITSSSATFNGTITADGNASTTVYGFNYGTTASYGSTASSSPSAYPLGAFNINVTGLSCNTTYHYQAVATNSVGTGTSTDVTFTTSVCPTTPLVSVQAPTSVSTSTATFNGTITNAGASTPTLRGFIFGTTTSYGLSTSTTGSYSTGPYSQSIRGLYCGTMYHLAASSTNANGTGTSTDTTFSTSDCEEPTVTSSAASSIGQISALLSGQITLAGSNGTATKIGIQYGLTTAYGSTTQATSSPGVWTASIPFAFNVYDLACNTTYHFRAFANNGVALNGSSTDRSFVTAACSPTDLISAQKKIDWTTNAGLVFSIPNRTAGRNAVTDDGAAGNGTTDDSTAIQNCLDSAADNTACYLPPGIYRLSSGINIPSNKTLLGAGANFTKLLADTGVNNVLSGGSSWTSSVSVYAGAYKGSTRLYLDSSDSDFSAYHVGDEIVLSQLNGENDENTAGYMGSAVAQTDKVTAIGGNYLDLATPIHYDYNMMFSPMVSDYPGGYKSAGVESLSIDRRQSGSGTGNNIYFNGCTNCYVRGVKSLNVWNWHVELEGNYGSVVRDSWFEQNWQYNCGGNACYGAAVYGRTSDSLVENNVFVHMRHSLITEYGGQGNIFGYNYSRQPIKEDGLSTDYLMGDMTTHGGQPMFNLWEGNIAGVMRFDQILGSTRWNTVFRNNIEVKGVPATHVAMFGVDDQVGNLYENIIGNVIGTSGLMASITRLGCEQDTCSGVASYNSSISLPDARVAATIFLHGNYDWNASSTTWNAGNSNHSLPNSLYRASQPSWWDASAWPGIGSDLGSITTFGANGLNGSTANPAYTRYIASTTAPVISSIASSTSATTATITWTTDENASTTVRYGATSSYGSASSTSAYSTSHSLTLTGLTGATTYHFRVESGDPDGNYSTSTDKTFTTSSGASAPTVTTSSASSITKTAATLNGLIASTGGADATQSGFAYGTSASLASVIATSTLGSQTGTASFNTSVSSLTCNTTYYSRAYATNSGGTGYGSIVSFVTSPCAPTVTTQSASSIGNSSATLNGNITALGGENSSVRGFAYGLTTAYGATTTESGSFSTGAYTGSATSLSCNTLYHVKSYATNSGGTSFGSDQTFTTSACAAPTVTTSAASSIGQTSASLNGSISATGGADATQSGFAYDTSSDLSVSAATSTLGSQTGTASFSSSASSLTCETVYYFRAYATNTTGTGYGSIVSFTTASCVAPVEESVPTRPSSQTRRTTTASVSSSIAASPSAFTAPVALPTLRQFIDTLILVGVIAPDMADTARAAVSAPASSAPAGNLQYRDQGASVRSLQEALAARGYLFATPNGTFGPATLAALKAFQKANGVPATGYYGPLTRAALGR